MNNLLNDETLHVYNFNEETYIEVFCNKLLPGKYSEKINMLQPHTMKEPFDKVCKWIKGEDMEELKKKTSQEDRRRRIGEGRHKEAQFSIIHLTTSFKRPNHTLNGATRRTIIIDVSPIILSTSIYLGE